MFDVMSILLPGPLANSLICVDSFPPIPPTPDYILINEALRKQLCFQMYLREKRGMISAHGAQYLRTSTGEVGSVAIARW